MIKKTTRSSIVALSACAGVLFVAGCGKPESITKDDGKMENGGMMQGEGTMENGGAMKGEGMMESGNMMKDQ